MYYINNKYYTCYEDAKEYIVTQFYTIKERYKINASISIMEEKNHVISASVCGGEVISGMVWKECFKGGTVRIDGQFVYLRFQGQFAEDTNEDGDDAVNHPKHYNSHPSGVECVTIAQAYDYCVGNAIKYLWRAGLKHEDGMSDKEKQVEDLKKAAWYINHEISRLEGGEK